MTTLGRVVAIAAAVGATSLVTGCMHIPQRAWDNGRAMQSTWQFQELSSGSVNPALLRGLYWQSNALSQGGPRRFSPGRW
jgi:hypothetical protein